MSEPGSSLPEKLGASAGMWAVFYLVVHYLILRSATAIPTMTDADYAKVLVGERMQWESATALRVMAGIMIVWFMGSVSARIRGGEGAAGRLASITFGIGTLWGGVWLLSAMFNSAAILCATEYGNVSGARLAGMLAREVPWILTPALTFTLMLAVAFATQRYGVFSRAYGQATAVLSVLVILLAIVEWYGPGNVGQVIMALALAWTAATSALTIGPYRREA